MHSDALDALRFPGDREAHARLLELPHVQRGMSTLDAVRARESHRTALLAQAVRVGRRTVPRLARALDRVAELLGRAGVLEAYVFPEPRINAFVTDEGDRTIIGVSSTAVQHLGDTELEFVLGHELGHAAFGHGAVSVEHLISSGAVGPRDAMRLLAWHRAAEVSADRVGLFAAGSLDAAGSAFFKMLSGLHSDQVEFEVEDLAAQWDELAREVVAMGGADHGRHSHPFPPLRMRAMSVYWAARTSGGSTDEADREIARMLAMMDPAAAQGDAAPDQLLSRFLFWGGLHVALADGQVSPSERARLAEFAPPDVDVEGACRSGPDALEHLQAGVRARRRKLSALELHRIVQGVLAVASADGTIDAAEVGRLHELGRVLGISADACDLMVTRFQAGSKE